MTHDPNNSLGDRITLRPVVLPDDEHFLRELYFTTREDVEGIFPDENLQRSFLRMQQQAQMLGYAEEFPSAAHDIIEFDGQPVGRLMVDRQPDLVRCVDISIMPESRGSGIGTALLKGLLRECSQKGVPCLLKVFVTNRAVKLYERLGFRSEGGDGVRYFMRWDA